VAEDLGSTVPTRPVQGDATDNLTALWPGTRLGRYTIAGTLGQGSFGITYRARDTQLDRDVAIKEYMPGGFAVRQPDAMVLPRSTQVADDFRWGRARFLAEAKTLAQLERAVGVVNVYDFLEANGTAYMVMELIPGETLEARLKRERRLSQTAIDGILPPLMDGLERVHAADYLHRDIKPSNILLDDDGRPTLIDFGAARVALQGYTQTATVIFTPDYAAFEQFTAANQGPWTDIYALGATLYQCVTGAPPPRALDRMVEDRLVPAAHAVRDGYAPGLLAAIDAALKLKAGDRPQTIKAWRGVLSGKTPTGSGDQAADGGWRRQRLRVVGGALVMCLAAGGAYLWQQRPKPPTPVAGDTPQTGPADLIKGDANADPQAAQKAAEAEAARRTEEKRLAEEKVRADEAARLGSRDCVQCPELVRIPPGSFTMGSSAAEQQREGIPKAYGDQELPQHAVTIGYAFRMGKYEVTRGEFAAFMQATGHSIVGSCPWRNPGFGQTDRDPVVCVSWDDARAYVAWLNQTTGKAYRLPSEAEWEYAARARTSTARYWGDGLQDACRYANVDESAFKCSDGHRTTAPVGKFLPNDFGLHDMLGNVWEWTADCWTGHYFNAPTNGDARSTGDCTRRVLRGGSWTVGPAHHVRAAYRASDVAAGRFVFVGFRVARSE